MVTGNTINNIPVLNRLYNSRGLITHKTVNKNCFIRPDGELWCLINERNQSLPIHRSTDNGFSWNLFEDDCSTVNEQNDTSGLNDNGPHPAMMISEMYDAVRVVFPDWPGSGTDWDLESSNYILSELEADGTTATQGNLTVATAVFQGNLQVAVSDNEFYIGYVDANKLNIRRLSPRSTLSVSSAANLSSPTSVLTYLGMCADKKGNVDCIFQDAPGDSTLKHVRYTEYNNSYGTVHDILNIGSAAVYDSVSIDVARDGNGTLCAVWSKVKFDDNTAVTIYYATSTDDGVTWDVNALSRTSGHSYYTDYITDEVDGRTTVIGGAQGGFLFSYVEDIGGGIPKTFVRQLTTSDAGSTYDLGDEKQIGTSNTLDSDPIVGLHFFNPIDTQLLDISDPGMVRVAYQVGEGNSATQVDVTPVAIKQELLSLSAYPSTLASEASFFDTDSADAQSLLVNFSVLTGPSDAVDFYTLGKTGTNTNRYIAAFNKAGTNYRLLKYEPDKETFMNDRSAYGNATEDSTVGILEPVSYAFPSPALNVNEQTEFVEQDTRRFYFPPTTFLDRTFVINEGGYLKRTVWLIQYDGNLYEISQIVPYFLSNEICYYSANAYVVGPSRDPFSRTILPSET